MQKLVIAINSIASQPLAFGLVVIGCVFAVFCKKTGIDITLAATIAGTGLGILKGDTSATKSQSVGGLPTSTMQVTEVLSPATFQPSPATPTQQPK